MISVAVVLLLFHYAGETAGDDTGQAYCVCRCDAKWGRNQAFTDQDNIVRLKINFSSRDLCLRALDTNSACAKGWRINCHFDDWTLFRRKRQDVLIEAVKRSAHSHRIQLDFGGTGTEGARLRWQGRSPLSSDHGIFDTERLCELMAMSDLYVHAADVEIEAIACLEGLRPGWFRSSRIRRFQLPRSLPSITGVLW